MDIDLGVELEPVEIFCLTLIYTYLTDEYKIQKCRFQSGVNSDYKITLS